LAGDWKLTNCLFLQFSKFYGGHGEPQIIETVDTKSVDRGAPLYIIFSNSELQDLRCSQRCCWMYKSSGMWHCVIPWVVTGILEDHSASVCRVKHFAWPWRWKHWNPSEHLKMIGRQCSITSDKTYGTTWLG
jgi:hypothetical protein